MPDAIVLSAAEHFEVLRNAVWVRFLARHPGVDRERFDDLYAEWWAREYERAARGTPSRAAAPAAFIAEAVHRVLIDDVRARGRGLAREEKGELEILDLEDQYAAAGADDTAAAAGYEALVHRVLTLVQGRLSERELRVFVFSYLYMQPLDVTARALGLTHPRVKKDRLKIVAKVGEEAWSVLTGELDLCAVYDERSLPAVFEMMSVHVEDCPVCAAALGGLRRGAFAVIGPEVLLAGSASTESVTHVFSDLLARLNAWLHRGVEIVAAAPPNGRTAAAVAVAATAVAGGASQVVPEIAHREHRPKPVARAPSPTAVASGRATATAVATRPIPAVRPRPRAAVATAAPHRDRPARRSRPAATATAAAGSEEFTSFEQQSGAPSQAAPTTSTSTAQAATSTRGSSTPSQEFGFESP